MNRTRSISISSRGLRNLAIGLTLACFMVGCEDAGSSVSPPADVVSAVAQPPEKRVEKKISGKLGSAGNKSRPD